MWITVKITALYGKNYRDNGKNSQKIRVFPNYREFHGNFSWKILPVY